MLKEPCHIRGKAKRIPRVPLFISCLNLSVYFVNWMRYNTLFYKQSVSIPAIPIL
jgi:hypothetical protein